MGKVILYAVTGLLLVGLGLRALAVRTHLITAILAINVVSAGVFMVLVAAAARHTPPDPVPHALVLTGIVVAVSATAVALALAVRTAALTGHLALTDTEDDDGA